MLTLLCKVELNLVLTVFMKWLSEIYRRFLVRWPHWTSISFFNKDLNKHLTLFPPSLILGEQDWDRARLQIGVSDLIQLITEGRFRHASGPAQCNTDSITFLPCSICNAKHPNDCSLVRSRGDLVAWRRELNGRKLTCMSRNHWCGSLKQFWSRSISKSFNTRIFNWLENGRKIVWTFKMPLFGNKYWGTGSQFKQFCHPFWHF